MVSRIGREVELSPVELGSQTAKRVEINLASGSPDPRVMPIREIREAYNYVIENYGAKSLFYPGAGGQEVLIERAWEYAEFLGVKRNKGDRLVVTSGAQHAIELLSLYFLDGNGRIAVENPTFVETFQPMKLLSSVVFPITVDSKGMRIEELEQVVKLTKIDFVYVIPNCHNPAGVNLDEERKKYLVELASKYDFYVIEDDPYRTIACDLGEPIKNYDREGRVIYVTTFSKVIAPGLRVGFFIANEEIANKVALMEQMDFSTSTLNQYVVARLLETKVPQSRRRQLYEYYGRKMKVMKDELASRGLKDYNEPKCGFFLLLDTHKNSQRVFQEAVKRGVSVVDAKPFFLRGGDTMLRLSVAVETEEKIAEGVRRLKEGVDAA
ncbi:MAG: PLP-dependent aminotransferase family protein [Thermoprotei archaeon]